MTSLNNKHINCILSAKIGDVIQFEDKYNSNKNTCGIVIGYFYIKYREFQEAYYPLVGLIKSRSDSPIYFNITHSFLKYIPSSIKDKYIKFAFIHPSDLNVVKIIKKNQNV